MDGTVNTAPYTVPPQVTDYHTIGDELSDHGISWRLSPLSAVSEDNLPNATPGAYVPKVRPAIGNLMTMFDFRHPDFATLQLPG